MTEKTVMKQGIAAWQYIIYIFHFSLVLMLPLACFGDYFIQFCVTDQLTAAAVNIYMTYKYKYKCKYKNENQYESSYLKVI